MEGSYRTHGTFPQAEAFGDQFADDDAYHDGAADQDDRTSLLKLVLYDLNTAVAPRELRLMAIHAALDEFDHGEPCVRPRRDPACVRAFPSPRAPLSLTRRPRPSPTSPGVARDGGPASGGRTFPAQPRRSLP